MNLENVRIPKRSDHGHCSCLKVEKQECDMNTEKDMTAPANLRDLGGMQCFFVTPFKICLYTAIKEYFEQVLSGIWPLDARIIILFIGYIEYLPEIHHLRIKNFWTLREPSFSAFISKISELDNKAGTEISTNTLKKVNKSLESYSSLHDLLIELFDQIERENETGDNFLFRRNSIIGIFSRKMMLEVQVMEIELTFDRLVHLHSLYCSYVQGNGRIEQSSQAVELGLELSGGVLAKEDITNHIDKLVYLTENDLLPRDSPNKIIKKLDFFAQSVDPEVKFEYLRYLACAQLGNFSETLSHVAKYFGLRDEEVPTKKNCGTGIGRHHYKYMMLADVYLQYGYPVLSIEAMEQAISISQESYDQESLLHHHIWRHEIAFEFPFLNTTFFDEIYRDFNYKDQLDSESELKYAYSYIAQSMAHIRLCIDQMDSPADVLKKMSDCRKSVILNGYDTCHSSCNLLLSTAWNLYGYPILAYIYATIVYSQRSCNVSLGDYVLSCTTLALQKALRGRYDVALKLLCRNRENCASYGENSKSQSILLSKTLAVLIQCAIYSENLTIAEKLVELLLPLTKLSQRSLMHFMFLKAALLRKQCEYDEALKIYSVLFKKLDNIGSVAMYYKIECNLSMAELYLEYGDAPNALLYAASANSLSSLVASSFQHCKSLLLLAEIERLLGHPQASLKILCRNLPKINRVEDQILYGRVMLTISSCLIDLCIPDLPSETSELGTFERQVLEINVNLLKESISSFARMWDISLLSKSLVVYYRVLASLKLYERSKLVEKNIISLHEFRKNRRGLNHRSTGEIMNIISRIYLSKKGFMTNDSDLNADVELLLRKFGAREITEFIVA